MRGIQWLIFGVVAIAVVILGLLLLAFTPGFGWIGRGYYGMMRGWCPWCGGIGYLSPIGIIASLVMMIFMWLLPLSLIALLAVGIYWLFRSGRPAGGGVRLHCPNCGAEIQPGWKACPTCGEKLGG